MRNLIVVGDSHLTTAKNLIHRRLGPKFDNVHFIPNRFLGNRWWELEENDYLHRFEITDPRVPNKTIEISRLDNNHLLLVGLRLSGDGLLRAFGSLTHEKTPPLPYEKLELSEKLINHIFYDYITKSLTPLKTLIEKSEHTSIRWILSPYMTERAAYSRFEHSFVKSGRFNKLKSTFENIFKIIRSEMKLKDEIFISDNRQTESGFNEDLYSISSREPSDIHVNEIFYESIVKGLHYYGPTSANGASQAPKTF